MADRIGVIDQGRIILVEEKHALMRRLGQTRVTVGLKKKMETVPPELFARPLELSEDGLSLSFTQKGADDNDSGLADLLKQLAARKIDFRTVNADRSSLEDIFIDLVGKSR
jgi:ABC-2 type transport system ATP-binding protein